MDIKSELTGDTVQPIQDDIFEKQRGNELVRVVYIDDQKTVLRSEQTHRNSDRNIHYHDNTDTFKSQIKHGRWERKPNVNTNIPKADPITERSSTQQNTPTPVAEANNNSTPKETLSTSDKTEDGDASEEGPNQEKETTEDTSPQKWREVPYIGEETESNLHDAGFNTPADILDAEEDDFDSVDNLGAGGIDRLKEYAKEQV